MAEKSEPKFVDGLIFKRPNEKTKEKAPWVKGHLSIKVDEFKNWLIKNQGGLWMNLDLKESKDKTKLYFQVNEWQPEKKEKPSEPKVEYPTEEAGDIPF